MLLNYSFSNLRRFKSIPTEVVGKVFVDGEDTNGGLAVLDGDGSLTVGPLNPPLPYRFIRLRGAEVTGQDNEGWERVSEQLAASGIYLLLLLDPRTYLLAPDILEDVQVVSQEDSKVTLGSTTFNRGQLCQPRNGGLHRQLKILNHD